MQQRFLLQILLLAQHVSGHHYAHHQELKSIIQWLLPVVFRAEVFKYAGLQSGIPLQTQRTHTHHMLCCHITTLSFYIFNKF